MQTAVAAATNPNRFKLRRGPMTGLSIASMPIIKDAILRAPLMTADEEATAFAALGLALDAAWSAVCVALDDPDARPYEDADWDALIAAQATARAQCKPGQHLAAVVRTAASVDALVDHILRANLRIVRAVASQLCRGNAGIMDLGDAVQEASIGFIKGIRRFQPGRGTRLSTFAVQWMRHHVGRARSDVSRTIRLPVHVEETASALVKASRKMGAMDVASAVRADLPRLAELTGRPEITIENAISVPRTVSGSVAASSNKFSDGGDARTLMDMLPDDAAAAVDILADKQVHRHLHRVLATALTERERYVLTRRYGLDGEDVDILENIGAHLGLSRERIRQIEVIAMNKVRRACPFLSIAVGV